MEPGLRFDIRWAGDNWRPRDIAMVEPHLPRAFNLVREGLDYLEMDAAGSHLLDIEKRTTHELDQLGIGECLNDNQLILRMDRRTIRAMRLSPTVGYVATTLLHEVLHDIRANVAYQNTFPEAIVSEGLAYTGHHAFLYFLERNGFQNIPPDHLGRDTTKHDLSPTSPLVVDFLDDLKTLPGSTVEHCQGLWDKWMEGKAVGCFIGQLAVNLSIAQGVHFKEVIEQPPMKILHTLKDYGHAIVEYNSA